MVFVLHKTIILQFSSFANANNFVVTNISLKQWFSTFSVPWPIFQPKLTSQPTLVNKIKFPSQNHSVL